MAKTYNTIPTTTTGSVYTAAAHNNIVTNVNNYRVPPMARVRRATSNFSVTAGSSGFFEWNSETYDTDGMYDGASPQRLTVQTAGVYLVVMNFVLQWSGTATVRDVQLIHTTSGGTETNIGGVFLDYTSTSVFLRASVAVNFDASVGDYFRGRLFTLTGGTSSSLLNDSTSNFSATWLGQVS
jgi:hypothetical protein